MISRSVIFIAVTLNILSVYSGTIDVPSTDELRSRLINGGANPLMGKGTFSRSGKGKVRGINVLTFSGVSAVQTTALEFDLPNSVIPKSTFYSYFTMNIH